MESSCTLAFLSGDPPDNARHSSCIGEACQLLAWEWEVSTSHIYREGNSTVADLFAHHGHSIGFGFHVLPSLPHNVLVCVQADLVSTLFPPNNN
ncbi:hypothetical protein LINGRAHAP2_LOCUS30338 [Linum grandiflorum]